MRNSNSKVMFYWQQQRGFTLIELLVVLAIIAILAVMTMPAFESATSKIQRTEGQLLLLEVQSHLERFQFSNQRYPKGLSELNAYQQDSIATEHAYYKISLDAPSSACPAVSCYRLVAEHRSKQLSERLVVNSSGSREGTW